MSCRVGTSAERLGAAGLAAIVVAGVTFLGSPRWGPTLSLIVLCCIFLLFVLGVSLSTLSVLSRPFSHAGLVGLIFTALLVLWVYRLFHSYEYQLQGIPH